MYKIINNHFKAAPVSCEILVDAEQKIIHLLDTAEKGKCSLDHAVGFIQKEILKQVDPRASVNDYFWIVYRTNGVASFFENEHFRPAPDKLLNVDFKKRMKEKASA